MILAAGRGERLRPLTDHVPKPLLQVGGRTLLGRHVSALAGAGVRLVVVNTAWRGELIRRVIGDGGQFGVSVQYSDEGESALETGGGIFRALPLLGKGPFLLINGDVWTDLDPGSVSPPGAGDLASLVLVDNPPQHPGGDFGLAGDRVVPTGDRLTYSGIAVLSPQLFGACADGAFPLGPLLRDAIAAGRVRGRHHAGAWFDTGTPDGLAAARAHAAAHPRR